VKRDIYRLISPFQAFVNAESAGGVILVATAVAAFAWANSPWAPVYEAMKHMPVSLGWGAYALSQSALHWVNDGLMALFFLLVGLEIKREVARGELSDRRAATLPVLAALGGMVVPALIYAAINRGGQGMAGWGIPMATDIAFALGIMALLGNRVPLGLKVFLTALAIADDLGAVLVIAVFYSHGLHWGALGAALGLWLGALAYSFAGGRRLPVYIVLGLAMWYFMLRSGVHATVAGILLALALPMTRSGRPQAEEVDHSQPLYRVEHALEGWVAYLVVPLFALFNAGFRLSDEAGFAAPVVLGAFWGLMLGKPLGVFGAAWLAVRARVADLPAGVNWRQLLGAAVLAGIGFTMSLFVADLAFGESALLDHAKLGVLTGSLASAIVGLALLGAVSRAPGRR